jgi:polar amino acid transport system substrate-binding protein
MALLKPFSLKIMCLALLFLFPLRDGVGGVSASPPELINGWYAWFPYQYLAFKGNQEVTPQLTGLDIEIVKELSKRVGQTIKYENVNWKQHQEDLKSGKRHFAAGATYTPEQAEYTYYSKPYREEENALFVLKNKKQDYPFKTVESFLHYLDAHPFRLAVVEGFRYADPKIIDYIENPQHIPYITRTKNDFESLHLLMEGKVDGFLADRLGGASIIWRQKQGKNITAIPLGIKTSIHLIFSKKNVSPQIVESYNQALDNFQNSKTYESLMEIYLYPSFLMQTVDAEWFDLLEIIGIIAFAISGLFIAIEERINLFGAFLLASLPSAGGLVIRDALLGRMPISILKSPLYFALIAGIIILGFAVTKILKKTSFFLGDSPSRVLWFKWIEIFCDALGLSVFVVTGVLISILYKTSPLWVWGPIFAFVSGAAGAMLRDGLRQHSSFPKLHQQCFAEIALLSGGALSLYLHYSFQQAQIDSVFIGVVVAFMGTLLLRLMAAKYKIRPLFFKV